MIEVIQTELLKYKRTFMRKLILLAPLFFVLYALPQKLFMPPDYFREWQSVLNLVYNWWPVLFIPLGIALVASLVSAMERKAGNYRSLLACPVSPAKIWLGKIVVMAIYLFVSTLVLMAATLLSGWLTAEGATPWFEIIVGGLTIWLTSLACLPIQLWAATWKGTVCSMALGLVGLIVGVIAAPKAYWVVVPWSWPIRLMCPIIGVHPNGTLLEATDPLLEASVIPIGIMVSLFSLIFLTGVTAAWFSRREVH